MKIIVFKYSRGPNDIVEEEHEFDENATEEEIMKEFNIWVWEKIGDYVTWYEK